MSRIGETGKLVATRSVVTDMHEDTDFALQVQDALSRYFSGDWGDCSTEDSKANDRAVRERDDRILAAYPTKNGRLYIQTEWDRSYTTVLYASEY